jgi:ABC-2 type transport system ATP-binding protein
MIEASGLRKSYRARRGRKGTSVEAVRRLRDEGMTIFLTTHYLDEADALCDRISIIDAGLIVGPTAIPQLMPALSNAGIEPGAVETRRPSLDDVFLAKTGRTLAD